MAKEKKLTVREEVGKESWEDLQRLLVDLKLMEITPKVNNLFHTRSIESDRSIKEIDKLQRLAYIEGQSNGAERMTAHQMTIAYTKHDKKVRNSGYDKGVADFYWWAEQKVYAQVEDDSDRHKTQRGLMAIRDALLKEHCCPFARTLKKDG